MSENARPRDLASLARSGATMVPPFTAMNRAAIEAQIAFERLARCLPKEDFEEARELSRTTCMSFEESVLWLHRTRDLARQAARALRWYRFDTLWGPIIGAAVILGTIGAAVLAAILQ